MRPKIRVAIPKDVVFLAKVLPGFYQQHFPSTRRNV
jgi:hypothetical protein